MIHKAHAEEIEYVSKKCCFSSILYLNKESQLKLQY